MSGRRRTLQLAQRWLLCAPSPSILGPEKPAASLLSSAYHTSRPCRQLTSGRVWKHAALTRASNHALSHEPRTLPDQILPSSLVRSLATSVTTAPPPPPSPQDSPRKERSSGGQVFMLAALGLGVSAFYYLYALPSLKKDEEGGEESASEEKRGGHQEEHTVSNWSGTHEVRTTRYFQPESVAELEQIVKTAHETKKKLRPVGSALSPNGIGLGPEGMVNMALLDKILSVDTEKRQVTVQAGARVAEVVEALRPHGLTLQNYASIREQQIGGFIQVGAHGTGASLPPVDETVVALKLVTPAQGTLTLTRESDPELFHLARCGLGALGVVAEVTLQCVPAHKLLEHTFVTDAGQIRKYHKDWLRWSQHIRYMWIPHTNAVVVVRSNPYKEGDKMPSGASKATIDERLAPLRNLYSELAVLYADGGIVQPERGWGWGRRRNRRGAAKGKKKGGEGDKDEESLLSPEEIRQLSFSELRDKILALDPLNKELVIRANRAEAEYWRRSHGYRVGWSDEILGFDCGGQQWVSEVSFPAGTLHRPNFYDLSFVDNLLYMIRREGLPAHTPIEQRWTASSRSPMSPASSPNRDAIFSWVGIIMYLPTEDPEVREKIKQKFFEYRALASRRLWDRYGAFEHWAKVEIPEDKEGRKKLQQRLRKRYPVDAFNAAREKLDPNNILANDIVDALFPRKKEE